MIRESLDEIGLRVGTDKASNHHDYLSFYENFFGPVRDAPLSILEIGVLNGASLDAWEAYFPNARIVGADIVAGSRRFARNSVTIEMMDQSNLEDLVRVAVAHGPFDIIIEDGSHMWEHQTTSLRTLFPFVKDGGIYIVEDLQTNYGQAVEHYRGVASSSCVEYLKRWLDLRVADDHLPIDEQEDPFLRTYGHAAQFMTFYRRACLIRKQMPQRSVPDQGQPLVAVARHPGSGTIRLLAHVSGLGDIFGVDGFVNSGSSPALFQGVSIYAPDDGIEFRVRGPDGIWSEWVGGDGFAGTRGLSRVLTGITVRLRPAATSRFILRVFARFAGHLECLEVGSDQDCVSTDNAALCGLQLELIPREA